MGLGDFLTAVPAYRAVRRACPGSTISLAALAALAPLIPLVGGLDGLHPTPGLGALRWPGPRPQLAVNLHGRGPESIDDLRSTDPARLVTFAHPARPAVSGPAWEPQAHEVLRWCRLIESAGMPADPGDLGLAVPAGGPAVPGCVVVHPGASAPARRWPPGRYAVVARALAATGRPVMVTGGAAERALAASVVRDAGLPESSLLAGRLDLAELAALVAHADLVVCGDTGVAHLASAYRTRSVLLFGPTSPARWGPPSAGPHTVLWSGTTGNAHADRPDPGLLSIGADQVLRAALARLAER